jgi:hypothetical protein
MTIFTLLMTRRLEKAFLLLLALSSPIFPTPHYAQLLQLMALFAVYIKERLTVVST